MVCLHHLGRFRLFRLHSCSDIFWLQGLPLGIQAQFGNIVPRMIPSFNKRHGRLNRNFISLLRKRENGEKGGTKYGLHQLPQSMLSRLSRENDRIPECVVSLRDALAARDFSACMTAVRHATVELADHTGPLEQREGVTPNSPQRDCFLLFGGPHVLTRILQVSDRMNLNSRAQVTPGVVFRYRLKVSPIEQYWAGGASATTQTHGSCDVSACSSCASFVTLPRRSRSSCAVTIACSSSSST